MKKVVEKYRRYKASDIAKLYGMNYVVIEVMAIEGTDDDGEYIWCGGIPDKMILFYKGNVNNYSSFVRCVYDNEYIELIVNNEEEFIELNTIRDNYFIWGKFYEYDGELYINCRDGIFDKKYETVLYKDEYSITVTLKESEIRNIKSSVFDEELKNKMEVALKNIENERNNNGS